MIQETYLCTQCAHVITNPMCPRCFAQHVLYWIRDKKISEKQKAKLVRRLMKIVNEAEQTPAKTKCIVCGYNNVNFCTYCFVEKSLKAIEKGVKNKQILDGFEEDFNADIWNIEIQ